MENLGEEEGDGPARGVGQREMSAKVEVALSRESMASAVAATGLFSSYPRCGCGL